MTIEMEQVNYRSGVDYILVLKDARGNDIGWPDYDWSAKVYTRRRMCAVEVSCRGGVPVNCWNDNGRVHVTLKDHRLEPGVMTIEFTAELPDGHFPDGSKPVAVPVEVGLELVRGAAPCPKQMQIELVLPYIKGDPLTWEDLTPEQMAELQRPAKEAADAFAPFAREAKESEATRVANEKTRVAQELARTDAETERAKAEKLRASTEESRAEAERGRVTAEEARVSAEEKRAMEFAGYKEAIDAKQDKLDTTEDLSLEDGVLSLTDRAKQRLFDDLFAQAAGPYGKVDHTHVEPDGEERHYYLNELWFTYEEAVMIYQISMPNSSGQRISEHRFSGVGVRTLLPIAYPSRLSGISASFMFAYTQKLEVVRFANSLIVENCRYFAFLAQGLKYVYGIIDVSQTKSSTDIQNTFDYTSNLVSFRLKGLKFNFRLDNAGHVDLDSLEYLITEAINTSPITITVHSDVYAKLADPENTEWHKVLTDALEKNISFATV